MPNEKKLSSTLEANELEPESVLAEAVRQLDRSRNDISHVGFPEAWASMHGKVVYQDKVR